MKKSIFIIAILIAIFSLKSNAQKYFTREGVIKFKAVKTAGDVICGADTKAATMVLDMATGDFHTAVTLGKFNFEKSLMKLHFLENYVEYSMYPKANFKGKYTLVNSADNLKKDGEHKVKISGTLTMHGVTKNVETTGILSVAGGEITARTDFQLLLTDYHIDYGGFYSKYFSNEVRVEVLCNLKELKN